MVFTSKDNGQTWSRARTTGAVLVIVPGAGTHANRDGFDLLEKTLRGYFRVYMRNTDSRNGGFLYPPKWSNIMRVQLTGHPADSLVGLARKIGADVESGSLVPDLIICGSRGGQVVLPMLLRHFWRGPFVCVNAGPLTSRCKLPKQCVPWFITCGRDYFPTRDEIFVQEEFIKLSEADGHNIRLTNSEHMPDLNNPLLASISKFILMGTRPSKWTNEDHTHTTLSPAVTPSTLTMTVKSHSGQPKVMLRKAARSARDWYADKRSLKNGQRVDVKKQDVDEKGHEMLFVETIDSSGWLYAMNIAELS